MNHEVPSQTAVKPLPISSASCPAVSESAASFTRALRLVCVAVIESFAELNLPIMNMEKASGLITTDWISFDRGDNKPDAVCSCGTMIFPLSEAGRAGKFNVFVKPAGSGCEMRVNAVFEAVFQFEDAIKKRECKSTGRLEKSIYERVLAKVSR